MSEHGELIAPGAVRFERLLPGPMERVWAFLTEPAKRAQWLCGGAMELRVGGHVELAFEHANLSPFEDDLPPEKYSDMPARVSYEGEVIECDPPRLLTFLWKDTDADSVVSFALAEVGERVLLTLTHERLDKYEHLIGACGGWHTHLDILAEVMAGLQPQPFWARHANMEQEYEVRLQTDR